MPMYLSGSAGTGSKIMKNLGKFRYSKIDQDVNHHFYNWTFDGYQSGILTIVVDDNGNISQDSLILCNHNPRSFARPLGLYNDSSLESVFAYILNNP